MQAHLFQPGIFFHLIFLLTNFLGVPQMFQVYSQRRACLLAICLSETFFSYLEFIEDHLLRGDFPDHLFKITPRPLLYFFYTLITIKTCSKRTNFRFLILSIIPLECKLSEAGFLLVLVISNTQNTVCTQFVLSKYLLNE